VCAPPPPAQSQCPADQVQTFVAGQETWQCLPTCDNGDYDQTYYDGQLVCVPC
jgi:hypothetical protein